MRKLGIFGGTFDPIHQGHLTLAACALRQLNLDRVLFLPAACSPFKTGQPSAPAADRLAMLRLAIQDCSEFEISTWEIEKAGISYTVDALRHFQQQFPQAELFLLMGEDTFGGFDRWREPQEIRRLARLAVAPRQSLNARTLPEDVIALAMPLCGTSSTTLRRTEDAAEYLPETVRTYIQDHGLYRAGKSANGSGI